MCVGELSGFMSPLGPTHVVAVTSPASISSVQNPGGIIGYNVVYRAGANPIWDITGVNTLTFKIKVDGAYQTLPSAQVINIHCKITRVIF